MMRHGNIVAVAMSTMVALTLMVISASPCSFVHVQAVSGAVVEVLDPSNGGSKTEASFGIFCNGRLLDLEDDFIWKLCKMFFSGAFLFGFLATAIAFTIVIFNRPSQLLWQLMSVLSAGSALLGVPVFLLLESRPCNDFPEQQMCRFGPVSYCLGIACILWVLVALLTQWFDPPLASKPRWKQILAWMGRGSENDDEGNNTPRRGPRRWFPLESDHESTTGWAVDEEEGLIPTEQPQKEESPVEESLEHLVEREVSEATIAMENSIGLLESSFRNPRSATTDPVEDLESEPPSEFSRSGPSVIYEDLEREAAETLAEETPLQEESADEPSAEQKLIDLTYSPDINQLPCLLDQVSDDSQEISHHESSQQESSPQESSDQESSLQATGPQEFAQPSHEEEPDTDLGSLEPSHESVTGEESILDRLSVSGINEDRVPTDSPSLADDQPLLMVEGEEQRQPTESPVPASNKTNARLADAVKKVMNKPVGRIFPGRRNKKKLHGYRLMDDTNLESSLPLSPPLEIVTMAMIDGALGDLDDEDKLEEEFVDIWDEMDRMVTPPSKYHTKHNAPNKLVDSNILESPTKISSAPKARRRSRKQRKRRSKKRQGSPTSVSSSSGSLLSYTIPEESESDLDDSDEEQDTQPEAETFDPYGSPRVDPLPLTRSRSVPNLAVFDQPSKSWEALDTTGANDVNKPAEVSPTSGNSSRGSLRTEEEGETSPRSVTHFGQGGHTIVSMPDSPMNRLPLFRAERELREGIHSTGGANSESSGEAGDFQSLPSFRSIKSYNARVARIRRLRQTPSSPTQCLGKYAVACVSPEEKSHSNREASLTMMGNKPSPQCLPPRPPPMSPSVHSRSIGDCTYDSGATLDELNAELAMLLRPDGLLQGPDESIV